jgi:hypothetical protein
LTIAENPRLFLDFDCMDKPTDQFRGLVSLVSLAAPLRAVGASAHSLPVMSSQI